jgi:succinylglutamic semialdehyde dehydrogenase
MSALREAASNYIGGRFQRLEGDQLRSTNPAQPDALIWAGTPRPDAVDDAVGAARSALRAWAGRSFDDRLEILRRWQAVTREHAERLAGLITDEMGKTLSESRQEAGAVAAKLDITVDEVSLSRVRGYELLLQETRRGYCRFKPHGVMAVIGPFNFPAHLPNGHFIPALLLGNTVVLKPSEKTPAVGQLLAELMHEAGVPPGVFNVIQGAGDIAASLVGHDDIDGILFTGSWPVGRRILETNLDRPGRVVALEMGGSNPAIVWSDAHVKQAVVECARGAFATSGQRCTCTRRIIVHADVADRFIGMLAKVASTLVIGPGRSQPVFMGPLVTADAAAAVVDGQDRLAQDGAILVPLTKPDVPGHFLTPGIVQVDRFQMDRDREVFGPLVQVAVVDGFDEAIEQANATNYGLAASVFTADPATFEAFFDAVRCGCVNHNTGTAGASGKLPFGGLGHSGNHRPAAAFSVDYCAYPVACMDESSPNVSVPEGMLWEDRWSQG